MSTIGNKKTTKNYARDLSVYGSKPWKTPLTCVKIYLKMAEMGQTPLGVGHFQDLWQFNTYYKKRKIAVFVFFLGVKLAEFWQIIAEFAKI